MKSLVIIYNILFLLVGNVLFSNIHHLHEHDDVNEHEIVECQECLILENSSNYISNHEKIDFSVNKTNLLEKNLSDFIGISVERKSLSRAPPTSK